MRSIRDIRWMWPRDLRVSIFGSEFSAPFGIAPTRIARVFRRDAELRLAEVAADANVQFVISVASMASIEQLARIAPQSTWYQVYPARDASITQDQIRRAADAGCAALVLTGWQRRLAGATSSTTVSRSAIRSIRNSSCSNHTK